MSLAIAFFVGIFYFVRLHRWAIEDRRRDRYNEGNADLPGQGILQRNDEASRMVQTPSKPLTIEEFLQLPETQPASEYIDGQILQKPMPKGQHSFLQTELASAINAALRPAKIARAASELRCTFGGQSIVPDISVFC